MHDLHWICALQSVAGEGMTFDEHWSALDGYASDLTPNEMSAIIHQLQANGMTSKECCLKKFTQHNLKKLKNWPAWDEAFNAQLDNHHESGALGTPNSLVYHLWHEWEMTEYPMYALEQCGQGQWHLQMLFLHGWVKVHCTMALPVCTNICLMHWAALYDLFFAVAAAMGLTVPFANTKNAYQQSPPPTKQGYLEIDDDYWSWYHIHFGMDINPKDYVIPVNKALQGHPEAGILWEKMIVSILKGKELGFKATTHERNLYRGTIDGETILVCQQVDDFAIASKSHTIADKLVAIINKHATMENQGIGIWDSYGMHSHYNGVDIHQTHICLYSRWWCCHLQVQTTSHCCHLFDWGRVHCCH